GGAIRRQNPERRQARRPACRTAHDVRVGDQSQDRAGSRPDDPAVGARASRSSDRVMDRRAFIAVVSASILATPLTGDAQQASKVPQIGLLSLNLAPNRHLHEAFRQGLHDLGYVEGHNLVIEYRDAEGKVERLPALAAQLVALKVDVIVTGGGTP